MGLKIQRIQLVVGENFFIQGQGVLTHIDATSHKADMELKDNVIDCTLTHRVDNNGMTSKHVAIPLGNIRSIIYMQEPVKLPVGKENKATPKEAKA